MPFRGAFGIWLKERRKALDLTQIDLADQVGCSVMTIRQIERGLRRPSKQIAERLADVLVISEEERPAFIAFARRATAWQEASTPSSISEIAAGNRPSAGTSFVGREIELVQIASF